jgi:membrane dipeptidase
VIAPSPPVVDLHADLAWRMVESGYDPLADAPAEHIDLRRLREGKVALLGAALYTPAEHAAPGAAAAYAARALAALRGLVARSGGALRFAATRGAAAAAAAAPDARGPALLLTMEGVAPFGEDPAALDRFHAVGLRVVGLTHNPRNAAGDGTGVPVAERRRGLTPFGRELVRRMGDLGIVPDIAHLAEEACGELFDLARGPVICTHAGARGVTEHWRNLSDAQLRAVAATGGAVGIDFYPPHIRVGGRADLAAVAAHMERVAEVAGPGAVAVGADFGGFDGEATAGLEDASRYPALAAFLRERGWGAAEVAAAFHGNLARLLAADPR